MLPGLSVLDGLFGGDRFDALYGKALVPPPFKSDLPSIRKLRLDWDKSLDVWYNLSVRDILDVSKLNSESLRVLEQSKKENDKINLLRDEKKVDLIKQPPTMSGIVPPVAPKDLFNVPPVTLGLFGTPAPFVAPLPSATPSIGLPVTSGTGLLTVPSQPLTFGSNLFSAAPSLPAPLPKPAATAFGLNLFSTVPAPSVPAPSPKPAATPFGLNLFSAVPAPSLPAPLPKPAATPFGLNLFSTVPAPSVPAPSPKPAATPFGLNLFSAVPAPSPNPTQVVTPLFGAPVTPSVAPSPKPQLPFSLSLFPTTSVTPSVAPSASVAPTFNLSLLPKLPAPTILSFAALPPLTLAPQLKPVVESIEPQPMGVRQANTPIFNSALANAIQFPSMEISPLIQQQELQVADEKKLNVGYGGKSNVSTLQVLNNINQQLLTEKGGYKMDDLKKFLRELGQSSQGKKADLVNRLQVYIKSQTSRK
jgi:hypothetical protein